MPTSLPPPIKLVDGRAPKPRNSITWPVLIWAAVVLVIAFSSQDKTELRQVETTAQAISGNSEIVVGARTGDRPYRLR
jgi:hypothetical protein